VRNNDRNTHPLTGKERELRVVRVVDEILCVQRGQRQAADQGHGSYRKSLAAVDLPRAHPIPPWWTPIYR
jgi:hypothetical protein